MSTHSPTTEAMWRFAKNQDRIQLPHPKVCKFTITAIINYKQP